MTREDINDIINAICPNDEDYEKPCISPKYLRQELEQLALDQRQWNEEPTTKNDLGVDKFDKAINQSDLEEWIMETFPDWCVGDVRLIMNHMDEMPAVTSQEPKTFKWCTNCKEYDQEKHCCHRWSKVIRDTVEEMKQKYIEREVLDEMRAEIEVYTDPQGFITISEGRFNSILDKYKAETEAEAMYNDKVIEMVKDIVDKAEKGEKTGNSKCPYCGGTVNYAYENGMAMRAKCLQCGFYLMA